MQVDGIFMLLKEVEDEDTLIELAGPSWVLVDREYHPMNDVFHLPFGIWICVSEMNVEVACLIISTGRLVRNDSWCRVGLGD